MLRRALGILERTLGTNHPNVGISLTTLATVLQLQDRAGEAEPLHRRALDIFERAFGPDHLSIAHTLNDLAGLLFMQDRYAEAEPLYQRALEICERVAGPDHPDTATELTNLALLNEVQGRAGTAVALHRRALDIRERVLGPDHPDTAESLNHLGEAYTALGRPGEAESLQRRATTVMRAWLAQGSNQLARDLARSRNPQSIFRSHLRTIAALLATAAKSRSLTDAGLATAQALRLTATEQAVAEMAARAAARDEAVNARVRALQDASSRWQALEHQREEALGRPRQQRDAAREAALREDAERWRAEIDRLHTLLARDFPDYAALAQPQPLTTDKMQDLQHQNEALLLYVADEQQSYRWVVRPDRDGLRVLPTGRAALAEHVAALRRGLDPRLEHREPFDVAAAHRLYQEILAPAADLLDGIDHLIVVPDGALESLPFTVLVTLPPAFTGIPRYRDYRSVAWLGRQKAISVLPAASSLKALRETAARPAGAEPFLGFGEPDLRGAQRPLMGAEAGDFGIRSGIADVEAVRRLPALPGTGEMLRAVARATGADPAGAVLVGADATVPRVRQAPLDRYRIVAFATHGLVADDLPGLAEPALVLTPPAAGTAEDDGLLTASRVTELRLNADWVLLTACNTAAPDGRPGAERLSGLARAFFYAGARSLLVSHWSVDRDAAIALVSELFNEGNRSAGRAEALRRAMTALIEGRHEIQFAHPAFWAPFVVVGEGG